MPSVFEIIAWALRRRRQRQ